MMILSENLLERKALSECQHRLNQLFLASERNGESIPYRKVYVIAKEGLEDGGWKIEDGGLRTEEPQSKSDFLPSRSSMLDPQSSDLWPPEAVHRLTAIAADALTSAESCHRHEVATLQHELEERESELICLKEHTLIMNSMITSLTHSRSWRMLEPLRALRRLLRPRGFGLGDLMPWNQLDEIPNEPNRWTSTGTDPQFLVPCCLPAGWLRIRLKMTSQIQGRLEIYVDTGHGFSSAECIERLIIGHGIDEDFYVRLPLPVRAVRIDPLDVEGEFHLQELRVEPVPTPVILMRALQSKIKLLLEYGLFWRSLGRGLLLLFRGQLPKFRDKLDKGLDGPSFQAPGWYDAN